MAKKNKKPNISDNKDINNILDYIDQGMSELYKDVYYTQDTNKQDLNDIQTNIDVTIDDIIHKTSSNMNLSGISKLYTRANLNNSINSSEFQKGINDIMSDDALVQQISTSYRENMFIKEYDDQIDMLCKYFSKLEDAIETKLDNVLSADHFTKDFINANNLTGKSEKIIMTTQRISNIKKSYNMEDRFEKWCRNTSKYGEQFIYIVPYDKAIERLLKTKNMNESTMITESNEIIGFLNNNKIACDCGIELNCYNGGVISSIVENVIMEDKIIKKNCGTSLNEEYLLEANSFNKTISDDIKFDFPKTAPSDGLISNNKETKLNVKGCIIKELERYKVQPIYLDNDINIGYYYIETELSMDSMGKSARYTMLSNNTLPGAAKRSQLMGSNSTDLFLNKLSSDISKNIDANFVNANLDLKNEIYLILKHSNINELNKLKINITFIPPEDMIHMYYKLDDKTHRGISDLADSMIPGTLYTSMYLTNTLGSITRGQDKRVYYVKQNIESNISKTLLNVVNQVKKGNFNIRSLNTMYNVLDIVGKYNDFIIPLSKSGESPIQFEVMQGQNIEIKQELYDLLEEMALNPTGVTKEIIDARNSLDYAIQATMSNSKFLRKILKRQSKTCPFLTRGLSMVYNYEYGENEVIEVNLPAPEILNISNLSQMMETNDNYIDKLIADEMNDAEELEKAIFRRKLTRYNLNSHIPYEVIDKYIKEAKVEYAVTKQSTDNEES